MEKWLSHWWGRDMAAGAIAAFAMALYMMIAMAASGLGFWTFPNVVAAVVPAFSPPSAGFELVPSLLGLAIHLIGGALFALAYGAIAWAIAPAIARHYRPALLTGALYAALIYVVQGRLIGPAVDPALAMLPMGHYLIGHLIFGTLMTLLITRNVRRREARITFAPQAPIEIPIERS